MQKSRYKQAVESECSCSLSIQKEIDLLRAKVVISSAKLPNFMRKYFALPQLILLTVKELNTSDRREFKSGVFHYIGDKRSANHKHAYLSSYP